ncbi:REV1 [Coprinopsis cinerea okayama7|uniref:DNA repair protein REV1 n=1 Tax=Coprinopsis cinerea (strain Okayama-7 / 130 / ATCC MYA-4618 / FGSC 9003) TaxID=240176 RepID=A8PA14_COPC7|nr:REV1 [Coprinopsis cinerea okayama7\|eukprot:XP_001839880.1 REV1 [Coprinopsis cinerea okayama7\
MVSQNSSDYFEEEDSQFLRALQEATLPGDLPKPAPEPQDVDEDGSDSDSSEDLAPPPPAQPYLKRRYSDLEEEEIREATTTTAEKVASEDADIYGPARFGGFGQYMHRKRAKLQIQNDSLKGKEVKDGIFKGLAIYINGWTQPSVQDLRQLIIQHGGVFQPYLDKKSIVTHIITCSLTPAKMREFKHMKVVRPEWLVESAKAGGLLPWRDFIYIPDGRPESSQGSKQRAQGLGDHVKLSGSSGSTTKAAKAPTPKPDPLYVTDPKSKEEAARVPGYASAISNPNAQRAMANPEWRKAHTSVAPDFIEGYYRNSRLHHLATWKAELRELVQEAQERAESNGGAIAEGAVAHLGKVPSERGGVSMRGVEFVMKSPGSKSKWKGKGRAVEVHDRVIMHCDFDCFFVAAGLVSRPELKGKPVVVCHSQGSQGGASSTSEIASCSYEARKFGVKNGMSLQQARQLCPMIITIPYEFERYKQFSLQFYTVLMSHADDLQAVSVDEAIIDVTEAVSQLRARTEDPTIDVAKDYAETIRAAVRNVTSCEISIGIAHNILLARLATRKAKPGGSYHLRPEEVPQYLAPLEITDLHGFGWQTKKKAQEKLGATSLGELTKKSKAQLIDALGRATGENLYNALRGVDDRKLESDKPRKSVSCEINYGIRFENNEQAEEFIRQMAAEVKKRLDAVNMVGRSVTLKIMKRDPSAPAEPAKFLGHGPCDVFSKQGALIGPGGRATSDDQIIGDHVWRMLKSFNFDPKDLRGIGIQIQKLEAPNSAPQVPLGQARLPFQRRNDGSRAAGTSKAGANSIGGHAAVAVQAPIGDPVKPSVESNQNQRAFDLPSFSQVDKSVLEALPREIREELENEYRRQPSTPFVSHSGPTNQPPGLRPPPRVTFESGFPSRRSNTPNIFPEKPGGPGNYKRITQQLAPKSRSSISPTKSALFALLERNMQKKQKKKVLAQVTDAKLRDLGIDPEVFAALPKSIQAEQLSRARLIKAKGELPSPPSERKVLKAKRLTLPPGFKVYRAPPPYARYRTVPTLRRHGKTKKEKLAFTDASDVQNVLETWVTTYRHWAPRQKDVDYLSKFLLQCVDGNVAADTGLETGVSVMKWWLVLLRRFWPGSELIEEGEPDGSQTDRVGQAWWDTFRELKEKMDVVVRKKFGGCLSLK